MSVKAVGRVATLSVGSHAGTGCHRHVPPACLPALDWVQSWLMAITGITFLTYGYDKLVAGTGATRVPERALLTLAFAGGTVGALLGMRLFHHKTSKESFLERFWLVVVGWYLFLYPH